VPDVVALGEVLIRLTAPSGMSLENVSSLLVHAVGSESNVAIGLARLGRSVGWISFVSNSPLGRMAIDSVRLHGVDTRGVVIVPEARTGLYFVELASPPRPATVLYDRARSAFALGKPDQVGWEVLDGAKLFHVSGVSLAVNPSLVSRALAEAHQRGIAVSFDVNYRSKLWTPDSAREALAAVLPGAALAICTAEDARYLFECKGSAEEMAHTLRTRFGVQTMVVTDADRGAVAVGEAGVFQAGGHKITVIDRIGAGDAFAAGFIDGYLSGDVEYGLKQGLALAALKHSFLGDIPWVTKKELQGLIDGVHEPWR